MLKEAAALGCVVEGSEDDGEEEEDEEDEWEDERDEIMAGGG